MVYPRDNGTERGRDLAGQLVDVPELGQAGQHPAEQIHGVSQAVLAGDAPAHQRGSGLRDRFRVERLLLECIDEPIDVIPQALLDRLPR
ncbi:MAG TPA: hypothetical protein VJ757_10950 [Pseudonocardiaceae bacterium]|nr:hypothetical protein [Pseudonocardiaceae bacterium]